MDPGTFDFNTLTLLVAIIGSTMGSTLTLITLMVSTAASPAGSWGTMSHMASSLPL